MRRIIYILAFVSMGISAFSQARYAEEINKVVTRNVALEPLLFLASDELMGRSSLRPEINIAARYISEQFKSLGLKEVQGTKDYFQTFTLRSYSPVSSGSLSVNNNTYTISNEILQMYGGDVNITAPIVFAGFTSREKLASADVKGKIVVMNFGFDDSSSYSDRWASVAAARKIATEQGAAALIVRYKPGEISWEQFQHHYNGDRVLRDDTHNFPQFMLNDTKSPLLEGAATATLKASGSRSLDVAARNVMGWVQGTDVKLKDQYIALTSHYDHIGVSRQPKMEEGKWDSIYNGARDNAIGVAAVLNAARYFVKHPPKRSILFINYTAEEVGLVGSRHFSENPTLPLKNIVYNINTDNAGYNDTTLISVVGLGRTSADNDIKSACAAYGLTAKPDPAPEQNLFDRSDNVSLAVKGIPAPTFSLGVAKFDSTVTNRYHQLSDETDDINMNYALKYIRAYILTAKKIADNPAQPTWIKNDKYEPAWKKLYSATTTP